MPVVAGSAHRTNGHSSIGQVVISLLTRWSSSDLQNAVVTIHCNVGSSHKREGNIRRANPETLDVVAETQLVELSYVGVRLSRPSRPSVLSEFPTRSKHGLPHPPGVKRGHRDDPGGSILGRPGGRENEIWRFDVR